LAQGALDIAAATNDDLGTRTQELRRTAKAVTGAAGENATVAANLRHEKLTQAFVSSMNAAKAAKELQLTLGESAGDKKVSSLADALMEAVSKFRDNLVNSDNLQVVWLKHRQTSPTSPKGRLPSGSQGEPMLEASCGSSILQSRLR
jgi:hypothetical protein